MAEIAGLRGWDAIEQQNLYAHVPNRAGAVVLWAFYLPHLNAAVQLPPADEIDRLLRDPAVLK